MKNQDISKIWRENFQLMVKNNIFKHRAEKAEAECLEQARLLGISGSREAALLSKIEQLEIELARLRAENIKLYNEQKWCERDAMKAEASLHDVSLDLSTANHMIKLERDRANALQTRLNELASILKKHNLID